jgi:hypothetical protein
MTESLMEARREARKAFRKMRSSFGTADDIKTVLAQVKENPDIPFKVEKGDDTVKVTLEGKTAFWGLRKGGNVWIISYDPEVFGGG